MAKQKPTLSARAAALPASPIRKFVPLADGAKKRGVRVYHLNIGQPDVPSPETFLKALSEYPNKIIAYGRSEGEVALREAYCEYYRRFGIDLSPGEILVTTGGSEALLFAFFCAAAAGEEIIVFEPFYTNYNGFAAVVGVTLKPLATEPGAGYHLPRRDVVEAAIGPRTRAIAICNPNNPTGTVYRDDELEMLAELARKHDLFIIADEVYREFVYDGQSHTSTLSLPAVAGRVVVTDSLSKRFSVCGARVGCLVSRNEEVVAAGLKLGQARLSPPVVEEFAATAALKLPPAEYVQPMIEKFERRRNVVYEAVAEMPGVAVHKPAGAFYTVPAFPVDDAEKFVAWMLTDFELDGATTMLAPAAGFYATPGRGTREARIAYVLEESELVHAMACLAEGLKQYPGRTA
ncbi:MAG: aminotransferase class I/II-fold pyridoxal phosphate-dependent enzyme [candidate division Zixibacteria bacterium]|nr:aminotransferase class I/II-fold pyridoxal phosphate-dependent enzyme [candidate division Zixibacteria bacterium]